MHCKIEVRIENVTKTSKQTKIVSQDNRFLKGTFILTAAGLVVKMIGSLNWIILSRVLGGEGIGIYIMAFPLYLLALSLSSAGIPVAISIITAEKIALGDYRGAKRVFSLSLALLVITGLVLSLLLFFSAGWLIDHRIIRDVRAYYSLIALSPAIFLVTIVSSFRGYLQGWQMMSPTAISQIVEQVFRVGTMLIFASLLLPRGLEFAAGGASLGAAAGAASALVVLIYCYFRLNRDPHAKLSSEAAPPYYEGSQYIVWRIIKLAWPVSLASLMLPLVANLDLLVVPLRLEAAGYSVKQATELFGYLTGMALPLVNLATVLTAALATSLVPAIAQAYSLGEKHNIYYRTAGAMRLANIATIPFSVMLWVLADPVVTLIYHAPGAAGATRVLAAGVFFLGIHQVTTGVLQGLGRTAIPVINMALSCVAKVALNWMLTAMPTLGIQGAAWSTLVDFGIVATLNLYFVHRYTGFFLDGGDLLKNSLAAVFMGGVMYFGYSTFVFWLGSQWLAMSAAIICGGITYGSTMLATGGINQRDLERIPILGRILHRPT